MSTFRERESKSKLLYWIRLKQLNDCRWAARLQRFKQRHKIRTKWDRRVEFHARTIGYKKREWEVAELSKRDLAKLIKENFEERWSRSLIRRTSLDFYRQHKGTRGFVDKLYDNSAGSGLFASARAGMLNTQVHRRHYTEVDVGCRLCGAEVESIEHLVLHCNRLGVREVSLEVALGFSVPRSFREINITKERLSGWEVLIRHRQS